MGFCCFLSMDISNLIDRPGDTTATTNSSRTSSVTSSPVISSRRQTVSSLLNDEPDAVPSSQVVERSVKPRKYLEPPIWAHKWNRKAKGPSNVGRGSTNSSTVAKQSTSAVNNGQVSLSGLPPSITGITPYEDVTRKITEWIYSHITQLSLEDRPGVEIELKFGTIISKATDKRIELPVITETIIRPDYARANTFFKATMSDEQFGRINTYLDELVNPRSPSSPLAPSVTRTDFKTRDDMYEPKNGNGKIRLTFDEHERLIAKITKRRVSDLIIYSPGDLLDIRISISVEKDYPNEVDQHQKPSATRNKNRLSYCASGIQIDLTSVISPGGRQPVSKELELELDVPALIGFYNAFQTKSDPRAMDKFEEVVRYAIDNTRILARAISR